MDVVPRATFRDAKKGTYRQRGVPFSCSAERASELAGMGLVDVVRKTGKRNRKDG